jgi:hypothetical protein
MSLGELTGGGLRAYYKLEDANDSSPNGFNLTSSGVSFNTSRFSKGADFGSSGSTQFMEINNNILSTTAPTPFTVMFRFKLNTTANTAARFFWHINTRDDTTTGMSFVCQYTISSGNISISFVKRVGAGNIFATLTIPASTTEWIFVVCNFRADYSTAMLVTRQNGSVFGIVAANTQTPTSFAGTFPEFTIGINIGKTAPAYAIIDELIVDEGGIYSIQTYSPYRANYYHQSRGFLV